MAIAPQTLPATANPTHAIKWRSKLIRLTQWEYWPTKVVYAPILVYYLYCALKARALVFVSAVNPSMDMGGLFGESKADILKQLPNRLKPITLFPEPNSSIDTVKELLAGNGVSYPIVCKPDIGERGLLVEKVANDARLQAYLDGVGGARFIIQEFVEYPIELGVFYYRYPNQAHGTISSIIIKEFLSVVGDGTSTIEQLLLLNDRGVLQLPKLYIRLGAEIYRVPVAGEQVLLEPIGNHSRGTKFVNGNHLINEKLMRVFDEINSASPGIFYGRYDIKCRSWEELYQGEGIKIMEINGAASEPGHIYDPSCSIWTGWAVLLSHWKVIYEIARINHAQGTPYTSIPTTYRKWKAYLDYYDRVDGEVI